MNFFPSSILYFYYTNMINKTIQSIERNCHFTQGHGDKERVNNMNCLSSTPGSVVYKKCRLGELYNLSVLQFLLMSNAQTALVPTSWSCKAWNSKCDLRISTSISWEQMQNIGPHLPSAESASDLYKDPQMTPTHVKFGKHFLWGLNEFIKVKHLEQWLPDSQGLIILPVIDIKMIWVCLSDLISFPRIYFHIVCKKYLIIAYLYNTHIYIFIYL